MSQLRLPFTTLSPAAYQGLLATNKALEESPLGLPLVELVYLRISQINGCAFCLGKHAQVLRDCEVSQAKLDCLAGWRISELFDERERAALAWAENLTHVSERGAPDALYEPLKAHFSDTEISDLTLVIALMNAFNRLAVGMKL
ncbi:carboxymuconolactone decarboxylase family protein [Pseudomonas alliivorans]|uniref:carboxymuconolactone decarboxylase family protein n=1 Tax=Pseudomonas viridiflava TaxID=33069 RepID=UPI000C075B23|nr:carboxymuconolactone decarboxylase family protein [Pseudomonas viridiflava]MEE4344257.1 carboxymuconolactone decarboxylase family protein [Pseudomonas alliivorans]MEE4662850.1 carboxymuconolactone decarboxylase family protein [Pseudomonas alliivorans]MEE4669673.1 carboxymuconolactone decarboxylase family protein [Pseudomonas alliivorans]MEE4819407.1 carboxymuconolactone decarboxylase family protein [Pseudomonas alliivorans]MEE4832563.1 carboxymuconolactone decarboxylase family protein [Pseu